MTELERHIINLLLDNDCVIVPGFGGFMVHRMPASYDKNNEIFLPPTRTIGFNPLLTMNDSLLAMAYANCYDLSYPEALRHIENDVDRLKQEIEKEGRHEINSLGVITLNKEGGYDFEPNSNGFVMPDLYGFDTFEMETLKDEEEDNIENSSSKQEDPPTKPIFTTPIFEADKKPSDEADKKDTEKHDKEISVRIPMRVVRQIVAACIIFAVFLTFPVKLGDSTSKTHVNHSALDTSVLYNILPKDITSGKPDSLTVCNPTNNSRSVVKTINGESEEMPETQNEQNFITIVLASRVTKANAENYVNKLHAQGLREARLYCGKGGTKVIYKQFKDKLSANKELRNLPKTSEFDGCWITEITQ